MKNFTEYYPITATPFVHSRSYTEILPLPALRPYIRCFWGSDIFSREMRAGCPRLVIPDTCADIIYTIDYTNHTVSGGFCGINDHSALSKDVFAEGQRVSFFGIRFYAWTAYLFSEDSLAESLNNFLHIGAQFSWLDRKLRERLFDLKNLQERCSFAEKLLTDKLESLRENPVVDSAVKHMILDNGALCMTQLAKDVFVSTRQLERLFREYVGVSPKRLNNLIRYQLLWRDIVTDKNFDVMDATVKYAYADQAHLCHEFKRYHSMDIKTAKMTAFHFVGNIQEKEAATGYHR